MRTIIIFLHLTIRFECSRQMNAIPNKISQQTIIVVVCKCNWPFGRMNETPSFELPSINTNLPLNLTEHNLFELQQITTNQLYYEWPEHTLRVLSTATCSSCIAFFSWNVSPLTAKQIHSAQKSNKNCGDRWKIYMSRKTNVTDLVHEFGSNRYLCSILWWNILAKSAVQKTRANKRRRWIEWAEWNSKKCVWMFFFCEWSDFVLTIDFHIYFAERENRTNTSGEKERKG